MDLERLSVEYSIRKMQDINIPQIYMICEGNPIYYQHCPPKVTIESIKRDMTMLPPGKKGEDKFYLGFYKQDTLIAVIDLLQDYPEKNIAYIGFFMMDSKQQGKGIGTKIITDICQYLNVCGYEKTQLGYAKGNAQSETFWLKNGFVKTGREVQADGYVIICMERLNQKGSL